MQGDHHVVLGGQSVNRFCEDNRSQDRVFDILARGEFASTSRNLDNAVRLHVGEGLQCPVDADDGSDIDRRVGIAPLKSGIEHRGILLGGRDWH